jgi:hypothetical protein
MDAHLTECVHEALAACLHRNAVFLAERLHASFPSEARVRAAARSVRSCALLTRRSRLQINSHLLASCYLRSKQPQRAYAVLKGAPCALRCCAATVPRR